MIINDLFNNKKPTVSESMAGKVVFSGTGANGGKYEIIQSGPTDFIIHANGKHIDTYGSLQRAMSVLQNEVPGLQKGMAEGSLNEFAPGVATGGGKKDYGQPVNARYMGGNKFVVGTTNNYILTATIDKYGLDWDDGWYLDSPGAAHLSDASEGEIPLPISTEQRHSIHDTVTDYLNDRNQADLQKIARYFGHGDDGQMHEQGVAEAQTDYQKRRQRERDVDAGKPVKPLPKNPQNDYFARRKKEQGMAENQDWMKDLEARAAAKSKPGTPYVPPKQDAEKQQRDLTAKYPNIDELVADAERNRDPYYDRAEGEAYYRGREAEQRYQRLRQIQRVIQGLTESTEAKTNTTQLNEMMLLEDQVYQSWRKIGTVLVERKLSQKEILQVFADAESGMTDRSTGANRTMLGRGKDATVDFAKDVSGAVSGILDSIQKSVPVSAVDVAYDQATDALGRVAGGQKGKVMQAIKTYRNLVKQYPKTAGFAKAALVAITGLATSGAGLPAIAGLTYALDSAIRGDKLSSVLGTGAGAYALTAAAQGIYTGASQTGTADTSAFTNVDQMGDYTGPTGGLDDTGTVTPGSPVAPPVDLQTYTVQTGDTLSDIAQRFNITVRELQGLNPQLVSAQPAVGGQMPNPDVIFPGQQLTLPAATGDSVYAGGVGTSTNTMSQIQRGNIPDSAILQRMAQRESIRYRILPLSEIVNRDATAREWALNESRSTARQRPVVLNTLGAYTVFENVDRYRKFVLEKVGEPGSTRPAYYRPDMPGGPGKKSKPGIIGRSLNWLDQKAKAVGGAISNFGHQFTSDVTKEKLKMNWHQDGKPSDSDKLAAWLVTQGVPQQVVTDVYAKMKIPYTPSAVEPVTQVPADQPTSAAEPTSATQDMPQYKEVPDASGTINPATGRGYTPSELAAEFGDYNFDKEERKAELVQLRKEAEAERLKDQLKKSLGDPRDTTSQIAKSMVNKGVLGTTPQVSSQTATRPAAQTTQPPGYSASSLAQQPGMSQYMQPQTTLKQPAAGFSQGPSGYKSTTMNVAPAASAKSTAGSTATTAQPQTITIGGQKIKPSDPAYAKIMKNAPGVTESLSWSKNFNPGWTLYRRMKQQPNTP